MVEKNTKKVDTLQRISPLDIPKVIRAHWNAEPKEPVHFIGEPSTVKSVGVFNESKILAEENKREFLDWNRSSLEQKEEALNNVSKYFVFADIRASETDIGELRLQEMNNGKHYITFKYNVLFRVLSEKDAMGVLFFDEMNLAPNMIKAQFYKIINDHCIGDIPISAGVMCASAGNESEHARGVTEDAMPLVLRRGNYFVRPLTEEEYVDFAIQSGQYSLISGYLKFEPQNVHKIDYDMHDSSGQPCPRTWSKLSNILSHNREMDDETFMIVARGLLGQPTAIKFVSYCNMAKKVDIDEVLRNPSIVKKYEEDLSVLYAIITGCVEKFRTDKKKIDAIFELSLHLREELGAFLLRQVKAMAGQSKFRAMAMESKSFDKVAQTYAKFFK